MTFDLKALRLRMVEIDYKHGHRHLPGALSALPIIAGIYETMDLAHDVFILSKGHACSALYAVLEACGYAPDVSKCHPERDLANGIAMTSGSLGHGLPTAVGVALAKRIRGEVGTVHVLIGDGEAQEGTTWEALNLAARFSITNLNVHLDDNGYQGSEAALVDDIGGRMAALFPIFIHCTKKGEGIAMFEREPARSVHMITAEEFAAINAELA